MSTDTIEAIAPTSAPAAELLSPLTLPAGPVETLPGLPSTDFPVNARGLALAILATIAFVFALQWSRIFLIPLVFSIVASYTLTPVVNWLEHIKIPRIAAVTLVLLALLSGALATANSLRPEFQSILVSLPDAARQISKAIANAQKGESGTMQKMQEAATEIEKATGQVADGNVTSRRAPALAAAARSSFKIQDWLWAGSMGAAGIIGQVTMVIFLVFFLLLSGDSFKRKLVKITGPSLSAKKITVHILDDINKSIQGYMFMLLVTNILLALLLWLVFRWIGLENAGAWAVVAGCLHIIPYFGPLIIAVATGLAAFIQFGTLSKMFLVSGSSLVVATLVGIFIVTWMTGRIAKMNAVAIFVGLLFWGWLWGFWGLLLGIPIIVMVRAVAEHVEGMQAVAELLSE